MPLWKGGRARRADHAIGAKGKAPDPRKAFKAGAEVLRRAQFVEMDERRNSVQVAADAALERLEAKGFPGAVERVDPKRKKRAAWYLCEVVGKRPYGGTGTSSFYLFSTGEVSDDQGRSALSVIELRRLIDALNALG